MAEIFHRLAAVEEQHADKWAAQLQSEAIPIPPYRPHWRTRTLAFLAQRFGPSVIMPTIANLEQGNAHSCLQREDSGDLARGEGSHARLLRSIDQPLPQGLHSSDIAQLEGCHRASSDNALRAADLGASDGLVSNLSLMMGAAGAALPIQSN